MSPLYWCHPSSSCAIQANLLEEKEEEEERGESEKDKKKGKGREREREKRERRGGETQAFLLGRALEM